MKVINFIPISSQLCRFNKLWYTTQKKKKLLYTSSLVLLLQGNAYHFVSKVCQCFWLYILLITFFWDLLIYLLKNVSFTTTDIDEGEEDKKCTDKQICVNKPGSYDCLCIKGYHKEGAECVPPLIITSNSPCCWWVYYI